MINVKEVLKMYHEDYLTLTEIADTYGCSKQHVHKVMKRAGHSFPKLPTHGFSDHQCRQRSILISLVRLCTGYAGLSRMLEIPPRSCQNWMKHHEISASNFRPATGPDSPFWKGGVFLGPDGYLRVDCRSVKYYEINPKWTQRHVCIHKAKVEKHYLSNNPLPRGYCTHHIDENRLNNELNNLVILTMSQHRRVHWLLLDLKKKCVDWDKEKCYLVGNRVDEMLKIWHSTNLCRIKIDIYLKSYDITETNIINSKDPKDPMFFLLDQAEDMRPEYKIHNPAGYDYKTRPTEVIKL